GQLQRELIAQEPAYPVPDFLRFLLGPGEPEQEVVAVPHIPQPTVAGIVRVAAGDSPAFAPQAAQPFAIPMLARVRDPDLHPCVSGIFTAAIAPGVIRYQMLFDEPVETVQVDVGHDG